MKTSDVEYLSIHFPRYIADAEKHFWRNFILLALDSSAFTFTVAMFSRDTILPYFVTRLSNSAVLVGLVQAVYFLGYLAPQLFGAYLAGRLTRRKPLILGILISQRVGLLLIALTAQGAAMFSPDTRLALFFFSFLVFSLLNGLIMPPYQDFISKHIIRQRGLFYGLTYALGGGVGFAASLVARQLLDQLPYPQNLQMIFWLGFASSFLSPFLVAGIRETPLPYTPPTEPLAAFFRAIPAHLRGAPVFLRYLAARACLGLALMANAFYAVYAIQTFQMREGALGLFTMVLLLAQSLSSLAWGWIGHRWGYRAVLVVAGVFLMLEGLLALLAPSEWAFFLIVFLMGGVYSATAISDPNFIYEVAPPQQTSRFIGIASSLLAPVAVIAPLLGGLLAQAFGYPALFLAVLVTALAALALLIFTVQEPRRLPPAA